MSRLRIVLVAPLFALAACSGSSSEPTPASSTGSDALDAPTTVDAVGSTGPATTVDAVGSTASPTTVDAVATTVASTAAAPDATEVESTDAAAAGAAATADRPYKVFVPSSYTESTPMPLVVLLHGYSASGDIQEAFFKLEPLAEERGFLTVHPDGLVDERGNRFWNATNACCGFGANAADDVAYLSAIVEEISAEYTVDPKRVHFIGHSNGGFMSYRMACERSDLVASIVSLAGATFADAEDCAATEPVSVLQIHGTADETVSFTGGDIFGNAYPSAEGSATAWANYDGCGALEPTSTRLDLDGGIDGAESSEEMATACPDGIDVGLWTIDGGKHIPGITSAFSAGAIDFLLSHPKP